MMPPSLSRLERDNPPPRRRSCSNCVRAKRRCSQTFPTCLRCAQREMPCQYPARMPRRSQIHASSDPSTPSVERLSVQDGFPEYRIIGQDFCEEVGTSQMDLDGLWDLDAQLTIDPLENVQDPGSCSAPSRLAFSSSADLFDIQGSFSEHCSETPLLDASLPGMAVSTRPSLQVATPRHFNVEAINQEVRDQLLYSLDQIKSAPQKMLLELQTPWCHPSLYKDEMPRSIQGQYQAVQSFVSQGLGCMRQGG